MSVSDEQDFALGDVPELEYDTKREDNEWAALGVPGFVKPGMSESEQRTPELVRRYRELHVTSSHYRLTLLEHIELGRVVDELRSRNILD